MVVSMLCLMTLIFPCKPSILLCSAPYTPFLKLCLWSTTDPSRTLRTARRIGRCAPSQSCSSTLAAVDHLRSSFPLQHGPDAVLLQHQYLALKLSFSLSARPSSILTELGLHLPGRPASAPPPPSAYESQAPHFLNAYFACGVLFFPAV